MNAIHYLVSIRQSHNKMWPIITFETEESAKSYINYRVENDITLEESDFSIDLIDHQDN